MSAAQAPAQPLRVLLLGDATARPEGLERALVRAGLQPVEPSAPGLDTDPPDLRLLTLPDPGRLETSLAAAAEGGTAPLVLILGSGAPADLARALALGAADALVAPVHFTELEARLRARAAAGAGIGPAVIDVVQEVWANVRTEEVLRALVRRVGRALDLAHCSIVLTRPGRDFGRVAAEYDRPTAGDFRLDLERYPEVLEAVRTAQPVVVPDVTIHPLFEEMRRRWAEEELTVPVTSVVALPVRADHDVLGVFLLRPRDPERPLNPAQVAFADGLARAAGGLLARSGARPERGPEDGRDPLTGCSTAALLELRLAEEFARAHRYSLTFSLVLLDIEALARINAEQGIDAGDRLLAGLGELLHHELRGPDFVARYGGDEFALLLPETGTEGARQSIERVRRRLDSDPFRELAPGTGPRLAAGIVTFPHPAVLAPDDLLALAEAALLRGKGQAEERTGTAEGAVGGAG